MRPQQRATKPDLDRAAAPERQLGIQRHTGELVMERLVGREQQRRERRRRRDDRVPEAARDLESGAVASCFRQRETARGEHDARRLNVPP